MAMLYMDGLDTYGTNTTDLQEGGWTWSGGAIAASAGRYGGNALLMAASDVLTRAFTMSGTTLVFAAAIKFVNVAGSADFLTFKNASGSALCMRLSITATREIQLKNSADSVVATSAANAVNNATWHWLEVKVTSIGNTATVTVRIDESQVISASNVDVTLSSSTVFDQVAVQCQANGLYWDDIVLMDGSGSELNDFLGDSRITTLSPISDDGTDADFAKSTGSDGYALIDDAVPGDHNGDTDYIYSSTPTDKSLFGFSDLPTNTLAVHCVATVTAAAKDDVGARTFKNVIKSSASESLGSEKTLATTYQPFRDYFATDPNGAGAWSKAAVDALLAGVQVES